ncbi:hypothetical protein N7447_005929 [Penicillium robsamsonii]|uniref:uncharacterized protein n=1 Tax=Penicillium robsamsonii TaxID=1792511 RepID=UPI002547DA4E|nr:uncharacterized protein N7447_005929 [Penicillium robsamsonii]KAJ5823589.1 hypothetical protein N7447_005929 [Penicillium robsamsonii]
MAPEKRTMLIDPDNIGRFAIAALMEPEHFSNRAIDIGGEPLMADLRLIILKTDLELRGSRRKS